MVLKLFNTLRRKKETFKPVNPELVRIYTCGPTVYDYAHIGNFRAYLFEDLLRRYLKFKGYKVNQVMNITDVDDKTIKNSMAQKISLKEYTDKYKKAFFEDVKTLNIEPAEVYPCATEHIQEMIQLIKVLLEKGFAYKGEDNCIYFNIIKFPDYGKLAHIDVSELKPGARVKQDEYEKEHVADFALWKAWDKNDGNVFWESPFGKGRPGWHIECSAMSMKHLTNCFEKGLFEPSKFETIDIHTGGIDNKFPHHEDEIAQSEAAVGKPFVKYWLHNEHLLVANRKMSKSLGNFFTLRDLLAKGYSSKAIRYILLATHYRKNLNFNFKALQSAQNSIDRLQDFIWNVLEADGKYTDLSSFIKEVELGFEKALDDDLNISKAIESLFDFVKEMNIFLSKNEISKENKEEIIKPLMRLDQLLGILEFKKELLPKQIEGLIKKREEARKKKDFTLADKIRTQLAEQGIFLDDTKEGVRWKRK